MKKNEIIELNGKEYTLELNRDSYVQIDKLCNIQKSMSFIQKDLYDYMDDVEIDDNFDVNSLNINEESLIEETELKEKTFYKIIERAFLIWLYPNHKLNITQVRELLKPYWEDTKKGVWLTEQYGKYLEECVKIKNDYIEEQKNLKALANKK